KPVEADLFGPGGEAIGRLKVAESGKVFEVTLQDGPTLHAVRKNITPGTDSFEPPWLLIDSSADDHLMIGLNPQMPEAYRGLLLVLGFLIPRMLLSGDD
ncbi:MAG: hypothetical protein ACFB51_10315, partial [Anaerolineae bacterium]